MELSDFFFFLSPLAGAGLVRRGKKISVIALKKKGWVGCGGGGDLQYFKVGKTEELLCKVNLLHTTPLCLPLAEYACCTRLQ